jgi:molecular chaperone Hsp33
MQILGDGPVRLLVAECNDNLEMRATAKCAPDVVIPDDATLQELVHTKKHGRFAITLDPKNKQHGQQPYQGIVPLDGKSISEVIENYMLRSEQLDTKLWLATNSQSARGLLLQKIPQEGGVYLNHQATQETWERCIILNSTLKPEEMLSTDIPTLIRPLYWEETLRLFPPSHPTFYCSCTRDKVKNMLKVLGEEEIENALTDLGTLDINCDFCGKHYSFDKIDCAQLFRPSVQSEDDSESSTKH